MGKFLEKLWMTLSLVGSAGYLVAIIVTLIDVVGRMSGISLIYGAIDIVIICMVLAGAFAVPLGEWKDIHIKVDTLTLWIPEHMRPWFDNFWRALTGVVLGAICWRALQEAILAHNYGAVMPSLGISTSLLGLLVFIGFACGAIAVLIRFILLLKDPQNSP